MGRFYHRIKRAFHSVPSALRAFGLWGNLTASVAVIVASLLRIVDSAFEIVLRLLVIPVFIILSLFNKRL